MSYIITAGIIADSTYDTSELSTFTVPTFEKAKEVAKQFISTFPFDEGDNDIEIEKLDAWDGKKHFATSFQEGPTFVITIANEILTGVPESFTSFVDNWRYKESDDE